MPRSPQPGPSSSLIGRSSGRISRKLGTSHELSSSSSSSAHSGRTDRKSGSYGYEPYSRRSLYHYHRDYYPSRRIFHWVSWPDCCRPICYTWGPRYTFGFFWPYYHRKFVFVTLGGYWPAYTYRRYYWYGCHPYRWYGDYPPGYVIAGDTYNYYYYDEAPQGEALNEAHREFEQAPPAEPSDESQADRYFEQAVKDFEAGDYAAAAAKFRNAQDSAPDDIVLPFARVQALFANGEYKAAAQGLREALTKTSPEEEGVFFPRGLYPDENTLQQHIEQLGRAAQLDPADSDLKLLLGYQLLGTGKFNEASRYLQGARLDDRNAQAATVLTNLLEKLNKADGAGPRVPGNAEAPSKPERAKVDITALAMAADNWLAHQ